MEEAFKGIRKLLVYHNKHCKKPIEREVFSDSDCEWVLNARLPTNQVYKSAVDKG